MIKLRKGGHRELERYHSLLDLDFDKREILPKAAMHKAMLKGDMELLIAYDESRMDLGYALVFSRGLYGYVLLKYMAVLPWYRGQGLGVELMRLINRRYAESQGVIAEITVFDDDGAYTKKLRKFFARFGYVRAEADYILSGQPVELMVKPIKGTEEISPVAHRIINDFYSRVLSPHKMSSMITIRPLGSLSEGAVGEAD